MAVCLHKKQIKHQIKHERNYVWQTIRSNNANSANNSDPFIRIALFAKHQKKLHQKRFIIISIPAWHSIRTFGWIILHRNHSTWPRQVVVYRPGLTKKLSKEQANIYTYTHKHTLNHTFHSLPRRLIIDRKHGSSGHVTAGIRSSWRNATWRWLTRCNPAQLPGRGRVQSSSSAIECSRCNNNNNNKKRKRQMGKAKTESKQKVAKPTYTPWFGMNFGVGFFFVISFFFKNVEIVFESLFGRLLCHLMSLYFKGRTQQ